MVTTNIAAELTTGIAIVGAGLAGLTCAQQLRHQGFDVCVLEKSRGVGGRLATRRVEGMPIDHGIPYLEPQGSRAEALIQQLMAVGVITRSDAPTPAYFAPQGMTAIAKYIAAQTPLYRQHRVEVLQRQGSSWRLQAVTPEGPCSVTAQGIVLAIPAPQVLPLLPPLPEADEMAAAIARVTFEPCFSAMVGYGGPVDDISSLGLQSPTPVLRWVGFEAAKRPMERVILTLQSSMTFAQQALDWPLAEVAACLVKSAETLSQVAALGAPQWQQGHRWRYAFCQQPCPQSCLARPDLALACCGDWCRPHQNVGAVETALRSGEAAATAIAAALSDSRG